MRRGIIRSIVAGLLAVMGAAFPATGFVMASQQDSTSSTLQPIEREFITVIRFANLWEIPMGQLAVKRGTTQSVKDAGATMADDHTKLDVAIKDLAARFDLRLPEEPTSSQQAWMAEISSKTGKEFDRTFANRLRGAHGTVFGLVSEVRAGTRNEVIRAFAQQANDVVMKHMTLLESTGLVEPMGMFAEASARTTDYPENTLGRRQIILAIMISLAAAVVTVLVVRALSAGWVTER
jgi:putative membrane protein